MFNMGPLRRDQAAPCTGVSHDSSDERDPYLVGIDAVVDRPSGLEVLQHALLELLGQTVDADEVLQVLHSCVVEGAAGVHALDDGGHVTEDQGVHQSCGGEQV